MLATVGAGPQSARELIPMIRELVDRDDAVLLRGILESAVGLSNGNGKCATPSMQELTSPPHAIGA